MEVEVSNGLPTIPPSTLVTNSAVDFRGRIANKLTTGGWKATPFIIVNEVAERIAFYAILLNMLIFLAKEMHKSLPDASTYITNWMGSAFVLTILGAFLADSHLGRFLTILIFSFIYVMGTILLTLVASLKTLRPPPCAFGSKTCKSATRHQSIILLTAMGLIALGTGGIKPCISSFGADQFDESDPTETQKKSSFFNWFYFAITFGVLISITFIVYLEDHKGWAWGFGLSASINILSILILLCGTRLYRYQLPRGSPFTRFIQVIIASCINYFNGIKVKNVNELYEVKTKESAIYGARKIPHTNRYNFFDLAAVVNGESKWRLCTVTQVEEFKSFIRIIPIWLTVIAFPIAFAQINFFIGQGLVMDRRITNKFVVPAGCVAVFASISALFFIPLYERFIAPRGVSSLRRVGIGLFITIPTFAVAGIIENFRRREAHNGNVLCFWWLFPQYFLLGIAEVFAYVGQLEFFYYEATDGTRSVGSAVFLSANGVGSWLSSLLVKIVVRETGGVGRGWLRRDLNLSKLDYFYWIVCGINVVNFCVFYVVVSRFYGENGGFSVDKKDEGLQNGSMMETGGEALT